MAPYAACYGGHQFGTWAGQLGDGRAITLGEVVNHASETWELQLKGAGPTPYSRRADGRAVLRSSLRELVCSEAMFHLGVPTTRALSLALTGEPVMRDLLYDGHPAHEPGAVVCRVAPSFLRFGSYEIHASRDDHETLRHARAVHARALLPAARRAARPPRVLRGGDAPHRVAGRGVDARRLRPRRDEHRQHVDPRPDDRLRPVRLARVVRSRLDAEHHRRARGGAIGSATSRRSRTGTSRSSRARSHRSSAISSRCARRSMRLPGSSRRSTVTRCCASSG